LPLFDGRPDRHQPSAETPTLPVGVVPRHLFVTQQVTVARCRAVDEARHAPVVAMVMTITTSFNDPLLVAVNCIRTTTEAGGAYICK